MLLYRALLRLVRYTSTDLSGLIREWARYTPFRPECEFSLGRDTESVGERNPVVLVDKFRARAIRPSDDTRNVVRGNSRCWASPASSLHTWKCRPNIERQRLALSCFSWAAEGPHARRHPRPV